MKCWTNSFIYLGAVNSFEKKIKTIYNKYIFTVNIKLIRTSLLQLVHRQNVDVVTL